MDVTFACSSILQKQGCQADSFALGRSVTVCEITRLENPFLSPINLGDLAAPESRLTSRNWKIAPQNMKLIHSPAVLAAATAFQALVASANPCVIDSHHDVTYRGIHRNGIEAFLNIPYGQDTGGKHRFKPPRLYKPAAGSTIHADAFGPACPQKLGPWIKPISLSNVTEVSEDCLNLNVVRPKNTSAKDGLPVMVFIHGGSFWTGQNQEVTITPDGMILQSVKNGLPVIHVAMNYRLGCKLNWTHWRNGDLGMNWC